MPQQTIRAQLETYKAANQKLESALGNGALAKKAVVAQQISDQLWTDPITQEVYRRYPVTITKYTTGSTLVINVAGQKTVVFQYAVREGVELQFLPGYPEQYIIGAIYDVVPLPIQDYEAVMECWDTFERDYRGTIWVGTTRDINDSNTYRQNGHPLLYNGEKEIRASGGDLVQLRITTPAGGTILVVANSQFSFRVFQLTRQRQG
ncbi:MAG: hypothetical protein A2W25_04140 [candidate division Zixibacteria bacterium RBG_16_53_22]|nr:MAG: hypothetical protein A2W25_04140 [candidate division Zixibacteria bacterium RBG_16_53_22]